MPTDHIDFRLTQDARNVQLLTLAKDPTYPSYHIRTHDSGDKYLPSVLIREPDVSISHQTYVAPAFAEATFQKYRNGISVIYPETSLRTLDGDVSTTVEDVLLLAKQDIKCDSLGERRYSLELDLGHGQREMCSWRPPTRDSEQSAVLELRRAGVQVGSQEALAKVLMKSWNTVGSGELIAVVRVSEDLIDGQEDGARGADEILVSAVFLVERLRRRHQYLGGVNGATLLL